MHRVQAEEGGGGAARSPGPIRIAAAGDVHVREGGEERIEAAFAGLHDDIDLILLAGDLTAHGDVTEGEVLARSFGELAPRVVAVLGNHDHHREQGEGIAAVLREAGATVLERDSEVREIRGTEVGIVGAKAFIGGFGGSRIPDFGEPLLRRVYAETTADVDALESGLREVETCWFRIVLLHYSPSEQTLVGEPEGIWSFLGNDRIAAPILDHEPDLVLHGHAHAGRLEGTIGSSPVFNVSVPVLGRDFWTLELDPETSPTSPIH